MSEAILNNSTSSRISFIATKYNRFTIRNCLFIHLTKDVLYGAAIYIHRNISELQVTHTVFASCKSQKYGGCIYTNGNINSKISYDSFFDCKSNFGLCAYFKDGSAEVQNCMSVPSNDEYNAMLYPFSFYKCQNKVDKVNISRFNLQCSGIYISSYEFTVKNSYFIDLKSKDYNFQVFLSKYDSNGYFKCFFINITNATCMYSSKKLLISECTFDTVIFKDNPSEIRLHKCNIINCTIGKGFILEDCFNESIPHIKVDETFIESNIEKISRNETYIYHREPIISHLSYNNLIIDKCHFQNITNGINSGTCIICQDSIRNIEIKNSFFYQIKNVYGYQISPSTIYISCYKTIITTSGNCYLESTGTFLFVRTSKIMSIFSFINQTSTTNLNPIGYLEKNTLELQNAPFNVNINTSNQYQRILFSDNKLISKFSVFSNNSINFLEILYHIYFKNSMIAYMNCFNNLKFKEHDEENQYCVIRSKKDDSVLNFSTNFVSEIDEKSYLLDVDHVYLEYNTFQNGIKLLYESLLSNESNVYTENVVFPKLEFKECKITEQKLAVYVIVLISIGIVSIIVVLSLISYICYKKRKIGKMQSDLILKTSIVSDFG